MSQGSKGKFVEASRGFQIHEWTNNDGTMPDQPFTTAPHGSFDWKRHATLEEARSHVATAAKPRKIWVEFEAYVPVDATDDEVYDWVQYELHANGSLSKSNPLSTHSLEAFDVDVDER